MAVEVAIATFKSDYEYVIEYWYDFLISDQLLSQNCFSSLFMTRRERGSRNKTGVTDVVII